MAKTQKVQDLFTGVLDSKPTTHETWHEFENSLSQIQKDYSAIPNHGRIQHKLVQLWQDNPEIRLEIGSQANPYWRTFNYNNDFFDLHYGQQLHVLAFLLTFTLKFKQNESNI
nr:MAG: hypothetical protein [Microvirus sp.]